LRLCCVGARAECTLPDEYWREFLIAAIMSSAGSLDNDKVQTEHTPIHYQIDFIGPDVPKHLTSKIISLFDRDVCTQQGQNPNYELTMNYHTSFLHEAILTFLQTSHASSSSGNIQSSSNSRTEQIRQFWDGFVLFNPGIGHPFLANQWKHTVKFLLRTGKPVLFTAHSALDAERDRAEFEKVLIDKQDEYQQSASVQYEINPYASRLEFEDPLPSSEGKIHVVRPNHSFFILPQNE